MLRSNIKQFVWEGDKIINCYDPKTHYLLSIRTCCAVCVISGSLGVSLVPQETLLRLNSEKMMSSMYMDGTVMK